MTYIRRFECLEAFCYDGDFIRSDRTCYVPDWAIKAIATKVLNFMSGNLFITLGEKVLFVGVGDYIVRTPRGEIIALTKEVFETLYGKI